MLAKLNILINVRPLQGKIIPNRSLGFAKLRKLAKEPHLTLLLNSLMTVLG